MPDAAPLATPTPTAEVARPPAAPPAPSAADSVVAAAFTPVIGTSGAKLEGGALGPSLTTVLPFAVLLVGVLALALFARRKRRAGGTSLAIVEATSLGPKRELLVVDVLGERLALGITEAGIAVLARQPAPLPAIEAPTPVYVAPPAKLEPMGFLDRLRGGKDTAVFEQRLQESLEDQELRAKLVAGMRGVVP